MAFADFFAGLRSRLHQGPFSTRDEMEPNLPNGGHTGYHPVQRHRQQTGLFQRTASQQAQRSGVPSWQMTGYQPEAESWGQNAGGQSWQSGGWQRAGAQQGGYASGGYVPVNGQQTGYQAGGFQQTGYQANGFQQTGYQANGFQQTGYQANGFQQTGYQANGFQQTGYQANGFQQTGYQANGAQQTGYQPARAQWGQSGFQAETPQEEPSRRRRFGREEAPAQPQQADGYLHIDNVTYMAGSYIGEDGMAYRHVERLTQPMSASTCYRLIEFMRNGETVIVNTELIRDEREKQRCLDLLFGAAFTMECSFTRISSKSIYLIAPKAVSVIPYESIRRMNEQDAAARWPGSRETISQETEASARRGEPFRRAQDGQTPLFRYAAGAE